jgi:hypothetical protein
LNSKPEETKTDPEIELNCSDDRGFILACKCVASELHRQTEDYRNVNVADDMTSRTDLRFFKGEFHDQGDA